MFRKVSLSVVFAAIALCLIIRGTGHSARPEVEPAAEASGSEKTTVKSLEQRFSTHVQPFLKRYCYTCHGTKKPEAQLDLRRYSNLAAIVNETGAWGLVLERLQAKEMPPDDAPRQPTAEERAAVVAWLGDLREREVQQNAGDPGIVLARRLSNAELDYTIRDLTGVDLRPTKEFPIDPANEAGFDNSGESLSMSPALLKKYLAAARWIADHVVLKPDGFVFAPHPAVTDSDRDKYCVGRIIAFYERHKVDLADYFLAAWKYRHRAKLGRADVQLDHMATEAGMSVKYLAMLWPALNDEAEVGPLAAIGKVWRELPSPKGTSEDAARRGCEQMRNVVLRLRGQLKSEVGKLHVKGISDGSQPLVLWRNRQSASRHRTYAGDPFAELLAGEQSKHESERRLRASLERFCALFPDAFVVSDRGPYFDPKAAGKGRPLTAGFHLMQGYFRDDQPLCDLILDDRQRRELDSLWQELDFITLAPLRQYKDFIFFERAEPPRFMHDAEFDFARSEDKDAISEAKIQRLARVYLARARKIGAEKAALGAIESYFAEINGAIRWVERTRLAAEPSHLASLLKFAERAYRRPLTAAERDDVLAFYHRQRREEDLSHEEALRDTLVTVLLSPHFCYRIDLAQSGARIKPLSDYALASRLSYFLWSSMPDDELLAHAAAGDLHETQVLTTQARRMLRDSRIRGLAAEFGGNSLDFRRFEEHNSVDRDRFPAFTPELRQAMFEEPIHYLLDLAQRNRSVLDLLYGNDTFVNQPLARHYGMPQPLSKANEWVHIKDARRYGRGGLLPMAVFLTKNAPGLRTSPVKRGYWVVRRLLGERIPPPPPTVPELPKDEAKLGELTLPQLLARHRDNVACAGCHRRFDSVGLVFEGFGPIGEQRTKDLAGHPVVTVATFPDGKEYDGLQGLRSYLRDKRQADYVDNFCRKLFSYALGRQVLLSDKKALDEMKAKLAANGYSFGSLVEAIITTPQFRNKRGRDDSRTR